MFFAIFIIKIMILIIIYEKSVFSIAKLMAGNGGFFMSKRGPSFAGYIIDPGRETERHVKRGRRATSNE